MRVADRMEVARHNFPGRAGHRGRHSHQLEGRIGGHLLGEAHVEVLHSFAVLESKAHQGHPRAVGGCENIHHRVTGLEEHRVAAGWVVCSSLAAGRQLVVRIDCDCRRFAVGLEQATDRIARRRGVHRLVAGTWVLVQNNHCLYLSSNSRSSDSVWKNHVSESRHDMMYYQVEGREHTLLP